MLTSDVVSAAEMRIGQTICGKWHLDRVIGIGGMAAVYEATHRNRNRVAIKLLHSLLSLDEGTRRRFLREGYVANTIRHSGAVQILDDDVTQEGVAFLVMELLIGESVEERMVRKGGALEIHEALNIADQLLDVLGAAHDQNVVHRDIKPDNIFLQDQGELKVLDFGIARLHQGESRLTKVGSFMGTPAFCAQEQARGRWDEVDHRTDLYSVGATLFTCLSGTHVHEAETSSEQLALAISATPRSLSTVLPGAPTDLVELVDTALAYDKEDRYQSARAMRAAVQRVAAGLPKPSKSSAPPTSANVTLGASDREPEILSPSAFPSLATGRRGAQFVALISLLVGLVFFIKGGWSTEEDVSALHKVSSPKIKRDRVTELVPVTPTFAQKTERTREGGNQPDEAVAATKSAPSLLSEQNTAPTLPQVKNRRSKPSLRVKVEASPQDGNTRRLSLRAKDEKPPSLSFPTPSSSSASTEENPPVNKRAADEDDLYLYHQ